MIADVIAEVGEARAMDQEAEPELWVPAAMYQFLEQELRVSLSCVSWLTRSGAQSRR